MNNGFGTNKIRKVDKMVEISQGAWFDKHPRQIKSCVLFSSSRIELIIKVIENVYGEPQMIS